MDWHRKTLVVKYHVISDGLTPETLVLVKHHVISDGLTPENITREISRDQWWIDTGKHYLWNITWSVMNWHRKTLLVKYHVISDELTPENTTCDLLTCARGFVRQLDTITAGFSTVLLRPPSRAGLVAETVLFCYFTYSLTEVGLKLKIRVGLFHFTFRSPWQPWP